jgi:hypothetical protein
MKKPRRWSRRPRGALLQAGELETRLNNAAALVVKQLYGFVSLGKAASAQRVL